MADISDAINVGGSLLSGFMGSRSAERAADQQAEMGRMAIEEQRRQFDLSRKDTAPWRRVGGQAMDELGFLLGLGGSPAVSAARRRVQAAEQRLDNLSAGGGGGGGRGGAGAASFYDPSRRAYSLRDSSGYAQPIGGGGGGGEGEDINDSGYDRTGRLIPAGGAGTGFNRAGRYVGGSYGGGSAGLADARAELEAARRALAEAEAQPWDPGAGYGSLMRDFGHEDFYKDPGYQFRLSEGAKSVYRPGSALGNYLSGAQAKALTRYNQGFASNEYSNAYNRDAANKARKFGFLSGAAGMGQGSAHQVANLGASMAGNVGNLQTQIGNVRAAGTVGSSNAWQNALGNIGNYYQTQQMLNQFKPTDSATTGLPSTFVSGSGSRWMPGAGRKYY